MPDEPIRSERLRLVPLRAADAGELTGLLDEAPLREWLRAEDVEGMRARFAAWESRRSPDGAEDWLNWVVRAAEDGRALGWVQATVRGEAASVAYALLPSERGSGVAGEALRALVPWLVERRGVSSVTAEIDDANVASGRVALAAGFERTDRVVGGERVWRWRGLGDGGSAAGATPPMNRTAPPGLNTTMRDLIITENITLDGVIDAAEGWFAPAGDEDIDQSDLITAIRAQSEAADAFLVGRRTFEEMRGYWPRQTDDETGVTDYLNRVHKYVVSSTLEDPEWEPTTILRGPLRDEVEALKSAPGKDIVVTGSMTLVADLIAERLVDEFRLFVYPVVLGRGRRLFEDATGVPNLKLVEAQRFGSGIVLLCYRVAESTI